MFKKAKQNYPCNPFTLKGKSVYSKRMVIYGHGQKSWDTFALVGRFSIHTCLTRSPTPQITLDCINQFFKFLNSVGGGRKNCKKISKRTHCFLRTPKNDRKFWIMHYCPKDVCLGLHERFATIGFLRMVWRDNVTVSKHSAQLLCSKLPQLFKKKKKKKQLVFTIRYIFLSQNNLGTVFGGRPLVCSCSVSKNHMYCITRLMFTTRH